MRITSQKLLEKHLKESHKVSVSGYLKEIVYGGSDGIITTFAVVAGFAGAQSGLLNNYPVFIVLIFGFANLFADAFSMAMGNMLSILADKDVYSTHREKEVLEIHESKEDEKSETLFLLQRQGFSKEDAEKITELYSKNPSYWADFMMRYELRMPTPEHENPLLTGGATFLSFIFFGFIPLIPYVFFADNENRFIISIVSVVGALIFLGSVRWKFTNQTLFRSVGETLILGGAAGFIAYFIGTLFK